MNWPIITRRRHIETFDIISTEWRRKNNLLVSKLIRAIGVEKFDADRQLDGILGIQAPCPPDIWETEAVWNFVRRVEQEHPTRSETKAEAHALRIKYRKAATKTYHHRDFGNDLTRLALAEEEAFLKEHPPKPNWWQRFMDNVT